MPAQLLFQDLEVSVTPPNGYLEPLSLTLGPAWQPNDLRVAMVTGAESGSNHASAPVQLNPDPPTGFNPAYSPTPGFATEGVYYRYLASGDTAPNVAWIKPTGWQYFCLALISVRGVDPAVAPAGGRLTELIKHNSPDSFCTIDPVTVPGAGVMVFMVGTIPDPQSTWPSWATSIGIPSGWRNVDATDKSGDKYYSYDNSPALAVVAKEFSSAGTTGTVTFPVGPGRHGFVGLYMFLRKAPDSSSTGTAIDETDSAGTSSASFANNSAVVGSPIVETDSLGTAFNPLAGYWVSDPYPLNGDPVAASRVTFEIVTPPGSTAVVRTSINNGLSWDVATNYGPVPRLREGDTSVRQVLARVDFTRNSPTGGIPRVKSLKVRIGCRVSTDELIPTFYGPVDKGKTKITPGSSGGIGGSSSGAGVASRGGGLFGGGAVVNVHASDPSRPIQLAEWQQVFTGPTGVTYDQLGKAMVLDRRPSQTLFNQFSSDHTVDSSLLVWGLGDGGNPWQDIRGVYAAIGGECYFDVIGSFDSRPIPDPRRGQISWNLDHTVRPVIIGLESELDTSQIVNGWVIKGESTTSANPVNAYAFNTDPASRYNIYDPPIGIGMRIKRKTFPLAKTTAQCQDIADGALNNSLGLANTVTIGIVPHPGMALGDIARINSPETGVLGRFLIQGYQLRDSVADQMLLTCFRQTDNP